MQYEFNFHNDPNCKVQLTTHNHRTYLVCLTCGVAGELEAISSKVSVADVIRIGRGISRTPLGKLSQGVKIDNGGGK